jgi:hypothetical protein
MPASSSDKKEVRETASKESYETSAESMSNTSWSRIPTNDSVYISTYIYISLSSMHGKRSTCTNKEREREREIHSTTKLGCSSIMRRKTKREVGFSTTKLKNCCYELGEEKTGRKQTQNSER